jgi:deoxyribodipyrimidine photo-lyase
MNVVWFKRDLRTRDHLPLVHAAGSGEPVICLYVYEPIVFQAETFDESHLQFINECLQELRADLAVRGTTLITRIGSVPEVLDQIHEACGGIDALWSHQETGEMVTYQRDIAVAAWCRKRGVRWRELAHFGVERGPSERDGWARRWQEQMSTPVMPAPSQIQAPRMKIHSEGIVSHARLNMAPTTKTDVQAGGMSVAAEILDSFLCSRGVNYRSDMSSPVEGWSGCSRLSPYLAYGAVSVRQVHQQTAARQAELRADKSRDPRWLKSLSSFQGRLRWHCHFIQKLEDQPSLEFENMCRAFDGLRDDFDQARFDAWCAGMTGYPMVDACMRALHQHGWVNFRMRAMLVSFASYHLWLDWRPTSRYLAQHFLDYEPGIHYSQFQMQSGVTGINSVRIYSPAKQVRDQDPSGQFIRRYVPELAHVPDEYLPEPHLMPTDVQAKVGCRIGRDYPAPIVDHKTAVAQANSRVWERRGKTATKQEAAKVYERHGSRRRPRPRRHSA